MPIKDAVVSDPVEQANDSVAKAEEALAKAKLERDAVAEKAEAEAAANAIPVKFCRNKDELVDGTIPNVESNDVTVVGDAGSPFLNAQRRAEGSAIVPGEFYVVVEQKKAAAAVADEEKKGTVAATAVVAEEKKSKK